MANPSGRWTRWGAVALLAFAAAVPTGCASTGNGGEGGGSRSDDIPLVVKILALPFFVLFALAGCGGDGEVSSDDCHRHCDDDDDDDGRRVSTWVRRSK